MTKNLILSIFKSIRWFCSAPMSDGFLVLAQIQNDDDMNQSASRSIPSCFFVPRWLPNGERNAFYIQRLKDKLGNRSNASTEIEFNNTQGVSKYTHICVFLYLLNLT